MKVPVKCPDCGWSIDVDSVHLGKSGRCKSCGITFKLETPPAALQPPDLESATDHPSLDEFTTTQKNEPLFSPDIGSQRSVARQKSGDQLSKSELPPKIREILWDDEALIYASRPEKNALIIQMILGGLMSLLSMFLIPIVMPIVLVCIYFSWRNQYYLVTAERTIISRGIFNVGIKTIFNRHIVMISINTGTIDRWLGLNSIQLATAAQGGGSGVIANFGFAKGCVELKYVKVGEVIKCYENLRLS